MPRFYFHIRNDTAEFADDAGLDLVGEEVMRQHARRLIADLVADELDGGSDNFNLSVTVRDGKGDLLTTFAAHTTLTITPDGRSQAS